jgi:dihydrofolate reductase
MGKDIGMRKVKYFVANSLDGFISRADGSVDWLFMDQDYGMSSFFASVDVAVMGRKTYDKIQELAPGQGFSPTINEYVFSRTRPSGMVRNTTFLNEPIGSWLDRTRQQPGKDIWLVGGGELVRAFLQEHLVDEVGLTIHPRLLGAGVPLFPAPYPETELQFISCKEYETGLVQVFYSVKR